MIPDLEYWISLYNDGNIPAWEIVCHVIKYLSHNGDKSDYDQIPEWMKVAVMNRINLYKIDGAWLVYSNNGVENYGPYADAFIAKFKTD